MITPFLPDWTPAGIQSGVNSALQIDHIGIAVRSIAAARILYEPIGMQISRVEEIEDEQVRVAMISLGPSRIELIEPTQTESVIGKFLERRGQGLHHIALQTEDLQAKLEELMTAGVRLVDRSIRFGAGGHPYFFIHPASTGGVLIEMVGLSPPSPASGNPEPV